MVIKNRDATNERVRRINRLYPWRLFSCWNEKLFPTYYAKEAEIFDTIHVSAGRRGLQMSVSPEDLLNVTHGKYADLTEDETILG